MAASSTVNFFMYIYILLVAVNYGDSLNTTEEMSWPRCSRKCHNNRESSLNSTDFPLFKCSCSPSCLTYHDCCYDSDYRKKTTWKEIEFICLSVTNRGPYKVVSGCPADQNSNFCKIGIGHLPPVTSRVTNTTYANIFCANCNGDGENLAFWNVDLRCAAKDGDANISVSDSTKIVYDNGHLWMFSESTGSKNLCIYHAHFDDFTLLDNLELRFCYTGKKISDCSPQWKNSGIRELCRSYEDPVYIGDKTLHNTHCAMCNYLTLKDVRCLPSNMEEILRFNRYDSSAVQLCLERGSNTCKKYLTDVVGRGRPFTFSSIINISQSACIPDTDERCCPPEKFDFRSKRCRKITRD